MSKCLIFKESRCLSYLELETYRPLLLFKILWVVRFVHLTFCLKSLYKKSSSRFSFKYIIIHPFFSYHTWFFRSCKLFCDTKHGFFCSCQPQNTVFSVPVNFFEILVSASHKRACKTSNSQFNFSFLFFDYPWRDFLNLRFRMPALPSNIQLAAKTRSII